jgi:hypothetical protein
MDGKFLHKIKIDFPRPSAQTGREVIIRGRDLPGRELTPLGQLTRNSVRLLLFLFSHGLPCPTSLPSTSQNNGALRCKQVKILIRIVPYATEQPFARSLQTAADSTQLVQQVPEDASTPFSVKLHEDSFRAYNIDTPSLDVEVTKESLLKMYTDMVTMRRMEQSADALYKSKLIRGFCHLAIGQVCSI